MPKKNVEVTAKLMDDFKVEAKGGDFTIIVDQPKNGGGNNEGPNPLEYLFFSLAGCIGTIGRIIAKQEHIDLKGLDIKISGELDTDFLMGKTTEGRAGFTKINVSVNIDAEMSEEEKIEFLKKLDARCPISDNIINSSDVKFQLVK